MTTTTTIPEPTTTDTRSVRACEGCGERAGGDAAGTGRPLVREKASRLFFHLSCKPGAMRSGQFLERMGAGYPSGYPHPQPKERDGR
jgi:hypothetical protein